VDALNDEAERLALLRLSGIPGVGRRRLRAAVEAVGSGVALLALDGPLRSAALEVVRAEPEPAAAGRETLDRCRAVGVQVVGWHEAAYPARLRHLVDPPPLLYVLGDVRHLHAPQVAIVGSRRATSYGRRTARALGRALASEGVVVLSGMALGIDGEAHRGALQGGGPSTAVLASGPERPSPRHHTRLHRELVRRGAVASEHPPATPSLAHHFPVRNRLMAALAQAVVVVEATRRSGALITAREAAEMGREVLAVPGPVDAPTSYGTNQLLADGAAPALDAGSVLRSAFPGVRHEGSLPREVEPDVAPGSDVALVWHALASAARAVDEVAGRAGLAPDRTLVALTRLELDGWVRQAPGLSFRRSEPAWDEGRARVLPVRDRSPS
jgi:DNA processing protein